MAVEFELDEATSSVRCTAQVETPGRTGVEMEALTAVQVGLLTIYDMCKAADRGMVMDGIRVLEKHGAERGLGGGVARDRSALVANQDAALRLERAQRASSLPSSGSNAFNSFEIASSTTSAIGSVCRFCWKGAFLSTVTNARSWSPRAARACRS